MALGRCLLVLKRSPLGRNNILRLEARLSGTFLRGSIPSRRGSVHSTLFCGGNLYQSCGYILARVRRRFRLDRLTKRGSVIQVQRFHARKRYTHVQVRLEDNRVRRPLRKVS